MTKQIQDAYIVAATHTPVGKAPKGVYSWAVVRRSNSESVGVAPGDEDAAVRGEHATEVRVGLEGRDEAVGAERDDPRADPQPPAVFA